MSYETDLKKIQKMWEAGQANKINIDFTNVEFGVNSDILYNISQKTNINSNITEIGDNALVAATSLVDIQPVGTHTGLQVLGRTVDVVIDNIPDRYIPFVRFSMVVDSQASAQGEINWFVQTEPKNPNDPSNSIFKATWHVCYFMQNSSTVDHPSTIPDFKLQVNLNILNPLADL